MSSTKPTKPTQPTSPKISSEPTKSPKSPAQTMQAEIEKPGAEAKLPVTLRGRNGFEYHLDLPRSAVEALIDPDVPDAFIEVPCSLQSMRRFLHTSEIKEVDVKGL